LFAGFGRPIEAAAKDELTILPDRLGSEPASMVVRKGDDKWFDVTR
jgi:hypothetical protein